MAEIVAGRALDRVKVRLVRSSRQSFALAWQKDGVDLALTGYTVTIEFGANIWTAVNNANISTWTLTEAQTALPDRYYEGIVVLTSAPGREVAYAVTLEVQGA
jgi:hypothetical protein